MVEWKTVPCCGGRYQVSNTGSVRSVINNHGDSCIKVLKQRVSKFGYSRVTLYFNKSPRNFFVHRLVAESFLKNEYGLPQVNHKDENKLNNHVDNLEWCSPSYNINYGNRNKVVAEKLSNYKFCSVGKQIEQIDASGNVVKIWRGSREIEKALNIPHSNILSCCHGKRKTRAGYVWRFAETA